MFRLTLRLFIGLACASAPGGCGLFGPPPPKPHIISFPKANKSDGTKGEPRMVGSITMVNKDGRFVLIQSDLWSAPAAGTALKCLRNGVDVGVVAVGAERRGGDVTADIVSGDPQRGDQVFQ